MSDLINPAPVRFEPGDILLTGRQSQGIVSLAIKLGQKLRFGFKSHYTIWSHTALVIDSDQGLCAEAVSTGVKITKIAERFPEGDYAIVSTGARMLRADRNQVLKFASSVVDAKSHYGFWTFAGLAIYCLTGSALCVQKAGTSICSGFVCDALTRAGYIWERPPYAMMPADIAKHFNLRYTSN